MFDSGKENYLNSEIRSPRSAAAGGSAPSQHRRPETWLETDIDQNRTRDRGPETQARMDKEYKVN